MKFTITFVFLFSFFFSNSLFDNIDESAIIVDYTHSTHIEGLPSPTAVNSTLVANSSFSIYEMDYAGNSNLIDEEDGDDGLVFISVRATKNPFIFKDLKNNIIYSEENISFKNFLVKDGTNIFNWVLANKKKTILNYECQEAKLNFRGRNYIAYFTSKIPFNVGPWKFSGLPGTILQIESTDGVFKINANKIKIKNKSTKISSPFSNLDEAISWEEFISKYKKKYNELLHYTGENGLTRSIPKRKIEVLIED